MSKCNSTPGYDHITSGPGAPLPSAVSTAFRFRDNALSKARFEPAKGRRAATVAPIPCSQFRWEDQFNLSLDPVTAREPERSGDRRRQYHDEPRRQAGTDTDCATHSPEGEPAVRRWGHQSLPQDGAKPARFCSMRMSEDVRRYEAEEGISEEELLEKGMADKSDEFVKTGAKIYEQARSATSYAASH